MTGLKKCLLSLFYLLAGILFFLLFYNFFLWEHVVFPQIQTEPSIGRDLTIRKYITEGKFSRQATFVFGSSLALNGVNCKMVDETAGALTGPCYNLGIPGSAGSFVFYLEDIVKLEPRNIIWVSDYQPGLFNPRILDACGPSDAALPARRKDFSSSLPDLAAFVMRWEYKNRLIDALMRINKSKGYGDVTRDFKNPVFILGEGGLMDASGINDRDLQLMLDMGVLPKETADCGSMIRNLLSYRRFVRERSPATKMIILLYPFQPAANSLLGGSRQLFLDDAYKRFMNRHQLLIVNLSDVLTEKKDWADRIHASASGVDKITAGLLRELMRLAMAESGNVF